MATDCEIDWILRAMVAIGGADGRLDEREVGLIRQIYRDQAGRDISVEDVRQAAAKRGDVFAQFAAAGSLDMAAKEEMIRAGYRVLLADERIAGEERKKLRDLAEALKIPEIHFGAILEDVTLHTKAPKIK